MMLVDPSKYGSTTRTDRQAGRQIRMHSIDIAWAGLVIYMYIIRRQVGRQAGR